MSYSLLLKKSKHNNIRNLNNKSETNIHTHSLVIQEEEEHEEQEVVNSNNLNNTTYSYIKIGNNKKEQQQEIKNYEKDYTKSTTIDQHKLNETHLKDEKNLSLNNDDLLSNNTNNNKNKYTYNNKFISIQNFNESETLTAEKCAAEDVLNLHEEKEKEEEEEKDDDYNYSNYIDDKNEEKIPLYKLRADSEFLLNNTNNTSNNSDWIRAPSYFDEQQIRELTNEQIQFTLDYFILSGYRVSQMTKTYYDIEAVTKLLDEKEKDLELAATIGKQLLEKDQQLEEKIEYLEFQLEKTSEMVNQLRYDITLKDNLLKSFLDSESDVSSYSLNESNSSNKKSQVNNSEERLSEYKKKIAELEDENDLLRNRAEFFENETIELEKKESILIENCFRELETSQKSLLTTQDELKAKTAQCNSQQEHLDKVHLQILELQSRIKCLTKDNTDLKLIYETSTIELQNQLNEMKEKYNECLRVLSKTQEELIQLKKKHSKPRTSSTYLQNATIETLISYDEETQSNPNILNNNSTQQLARNIPYSTWLPSNPNSLASEVFCSLAKDYRAKNSNLPRQTSQSSEFVKKVKEKLSKQIPGSNFDSCLPSDSEVDLMNNSSTSIGFNSTSISSIDLENAILRQQKNQFVVTNSNNRAKFTNCPTPDSVLSTGSASIYSNLVGRSCSFILPEKLKIVKPIEGSQTLQHWQQLARPNLGCLFESRPGITVKASQELLNCDNNNNNKLEQTKYNYLDEFDDGVNLEMYDDDDNDDVISHEYDEQNSIIMDSFNQEMNIYNLSKPKTNTNQLSPSRVELLSKLLEKEEQDNVNDFKQEKQIESRNFFRDLFKNLSKKFSKSEDLAIENNNNNKQNTSRQIKYDLDDPDTPPSSPINNQLITKENSNILLEVFKSAKLKCKSAFVEPFSIYFQTANAPTPPATPNNELDDDYINSNEFNLDETSKQQQQTPMNFFDQIVNKLNIFSFKSVSNQQTTDNSNDKPLIIKPLPIYANSKQSNLSECNEEENIFRLEEDDIEVDDDDNNENIRTDMDTEIEHVLENINIKTCETPPSSPSKFSPPLNYEDESNLNKSNGAFARVASLNPYINKSVDLASLLGSLSSLKRNQRLCKYY